MQPVPRVDDPTVAPSNIESTGHGMSNDCNSALCEKISDIDAQVQGEWTEEEEKAVRRKLDMHIVPIITALYLFCFMDRYVIIKLES